MQTKVIRKRDVPPQATEWGSFQWLVSASNGASQHMTVGRVSFLPGQGNPPHRHPNCEEILFVMDGEIEHTLPEGGSVRLQAGDCIVLPPGGGHQAKNIGDKEAVVLVAFNSAYRETVGE